MELECITTDADSVPEGVNPNAISIKGYTKKASDSKEAFFVTNRTDRVGKKPAAVNIDVDADGKITGLF